MYYSISLNDKKFAFFINYLNNIISGSNQYEEIVNPIISDAHELALGIKDYYTIDRYGFPLIVYLVEKEGDFFKNLDVGKLSNDEYRYILSIVSKVDSEINYV